jgi:TolB-like protein
MFALSLSLALAIAAQEEAAAPLAGSAERTRLAVMSLSAAGVPEEYSVGLTESLATEIAKTGVFEVISPRQISSLLAYEKRKELLGGCVQDACYVQIAQTVKAEHLVGGSVAKVGDKLVLNLVLIDAGKGAALKRTERDTASASDLMREAKSAAIVLLQPVLSDRRGFVKVAVNVPDAAVFIDDERRIEGSGQVIPLSAGPHVLRVSQDGFYAATADLYVRPGRVSEETVKLIPARETIEAYESQASLMRYGAYATGALAVGAAIASAIFYSAASDDKAYVDRYASALDIQRASGAVGTLDQARDAQDSFNTNQALYLTALGTALVTGGVSLYLFLSGDDPDRYEEFHSVAK